MSCQMEGCQRTVTPLCFQHPQQLAAFCTLDPFQGCASDVKDQMHQNRGRLFQDYREMDIWSVE